MKDNNLCALIYISFLLFMLAIFAISVFGAGLR